MSVTGIRSQTKPTITPLPTTGPANPANNTTNNDEDLFVGPPAPTSNNAPSRTPSILRGGIFAGAGMAIMSMFGFSLIAILLVGILGALLGSLFFAGMNSRHNNNDDTNPSTQQQNNQPTQQVAGVPSPRTQSPQARRTSAPPPASQPELIPHPSLDTSPLPALQNPIRASA